MKAVKTKTPPISFFLFIPFVLYIILYTGYSLASNELPPELKRLEIKDSFIKLESKEVGKISEITGKGKLIVIHRAEQEAYYAHEGDMIYENDALYTRHDCRCRLAFKDKNIIIMATDTHLAIDEVRNSIIKGEKKSIFDITKGKAIFYALRLFRYPKMKMQLKTPTATIGVRGTKFGAEVKAIGEGRAGILDQMIVSRSPAFVRIASSKPNIATDVYVFEGKVGVTSLIDGSQKSLHENEILRADQRGLSEISFDPAKIKSFIESVMGDTVSISEMEQRSLDDIHHREDVERREKMDEVRQMQIEPHVAPHEEPGGGEAHHGDPN